MIGRGCCLFDPDWLVAVCICILYRSKSPSSRHSISYWVFTVSARASRAAACVSRPSSLSLLNYSELQRDKTCHCLVLSTMSDWTANLFSLFQTNVEIKRELRYCDGFKCKSIYFIPQVCVHVVIIFCILNTDVREDARPAGPYAPSPAAACTASWTPMVSSPGTTSPGCTRITRQPS